MKIQLRHDAAAAWTAANPVLADGEFGIEDDTGLFKIGRAGATWTDLLYPVGGSGMSQTDADARYVQLSTLATVATSGSYGDLSGLPVLGTAAAMASTAFATAAQGALAGTAVQPSSLATVATTGAYSDLSGKPNLSGYLTANQTITLSGDLTGSGTTAVVATLPATGVAVGTYGDATHVAQITVDAKGRITGATNVAVSGGGGGSVNWGGIGGTLSAQTDLQSALDAKATKASSLAGYGITDAATSAQGTKADSAVQPAGLTWTAVVGKPSFATVATSGSYTDLTSKPTIPAAQVNADWNAASGVAQVLNKPPLGTAAAQNTTAFATAAQGAKADAAWPAASLTGATKIAVVATLPGTPDANTLYFTTT